jgi:hypothetical protein
MMAMINLILCLQKIATIFLLPIRVDEDVVERDSLTIQSRHKHVPKEDASSRIVQVDLALTLLK